MNKLHSKSFIGNINMEKQCCEPANWDELL